MSTKQRRINNYELQERLEVSTTSEVWKSFDVEQHRIAALKLFHMHAQTASGNIPRFMREAQAIASLHHPNIVQIFNFQTVQGPDPATVEAYLAMEYIEGPTLADYLHATAHQGNFFSPNEIVQLLTSVAAALDYMHQQGIVHGNLRSDTILLDKRGASPQAAGEPKLIDIGMGYLREPLDQSMSRAAYASPEVAQGYAGNERSDLYSLGVILYEMCTGALPFQGATPDEVLSGHIHAMPTSPMLINPRILPALAAVTMRGLAKNPVERPPNATALVSAIARTLNATPQMTRNTNPSLPGISQASSQTGMDTRNSPTYLSPQPQRSMQGANVSQQADWQTRPPAASAGPVSSPGISGAFTWQSPQPYPAVNAPDPDATIRRSIPAALQAPLSPPAAPPTGPSAAPPMPPPARRGRRNLYIVLAGLVVLVLLASILGTLFLNARSSNTTDNGAGSAPVVGHAFFVSSGLLNQQSNQGFADGLQIQLNNIAAPPAGKSYYAWLLKDSNSNWEPLSLGTLSVKAGDVSVSYPGDATHDDLLASYSRFLVTEEDSGTPPSNPSLDPSTWRYHAAFSQLKNPGDPYSQLDHLRHLLAVDPKLKAVGLPSGLDIWLFRNTLKVLEASGTVRDAQKGQSIDSAKFMRRELVRILDYLDSSQYVGRENIPAGVPTVQVEPALVVRVALLEFDEQNQQPPGYLKHIGNHLGEIVQVPGITPEQKALAIQINKAINNVRGWLQTVHDDAAKLVAMSDNELLQPQTVPLLDDMFTAANETFVGHIDPNTNQVQEGVSQIHYNIQRLATFDITGCTANSCI